MHTKPYWSICGNRLLLTTPDHQLLFGLSSLTDTSVQFRLRPFAHTEDTIFTVRKGSRDQARVMQCYCKVLSSDALDELYQMGYMLIEAMRGNKRHPFSVRLYDTPVSVTGITTDYISFGYCARSEVTFARAQVERGIDGDTSVIHFFPAAAHFCKTIWEARDEALALAA